MTKQYYKDVIDPQREVAVIERKGGMMKRTRARKLNEVMERLQKNK